MTTLPLFWHLSSVSRKERLDASVKLVSSLEQFQAKFVPKEPPSTSTSDSDDDDAPIHKVDLLDALNAQDVSYSIRRLIRGLSSPRESSRLGFAVALTEVSYTHRKKKLPLTLTYRSAAVSHKHSYMCANCKPDPRWDQDSRFHDWTGGTGYALCKAFRVHLYHSVRLACPNGSACYFAIGCSTDIQPVQLRAGRKRTFRAG